MKRKIHSCSIACFSNFYEDLKSYNGGNVTVKLYFWDTASIDKLLLLFLSSMNVYKHIFICIHRQQGHTNRIFKRESALCLCFFLNFLCVVFIGHADLNYLTGINIQYYMNMDSLNLIISLPKDISEQVFSIDFHILYCYFYHKIIFFSNSEPT